MAGPRTTEPTAFLSTRFGRRMFALFLVCAGVPIVCLAGLAWAQVSSELREQASRRLHAASRSTGMRILERLIASADSLSGGEARAVSELAERFSAVAVRARPDGAWSTRFGTPPPDLALTPEDRAALVEGGTVLRLVEEDGRVALVALRRGPSGAEVAARLRTDRLFDVSSDDLCPPDADFCVFDGSGTALGCSLEGRPPPPALASDRESPTLVSWRVAGGDYLAVPWTLFLKGNFRLSEWTVLVAQPESVVYGPMRGFGLLVALVASLGLLLASLFSVQQIRRRLVPLERLATATGRVAASDFGVRVDIEADDEFAELASAFNAMALRLDHQFQALERVIEIDRGILGAQDEIALAEAFLGPLRRIYPCLLMVLGVPRRDADEVRRIYVCDASGAVASRTLAISAVDDPVAQSLPVDELFPAADLPPALRRSLPSAAATCLIVPLAQEGASGGFVLACHGDDEIVPRERLLYLRQICDQLAAALRGAALRRQNEQLRRFDPLTGLPNQRWLEQRVAERMAGVRGPRPTLLGLARLAIDGLDRVRSTYGPGEVEGIVRRVGDRLRAEGGESAVRLDGGEFGLLAEGAAVEDLTRGLRAGCDAVREVLLAEERAVYLHARAGAAVGPGDASDAAGLLACADAALRHASREGSGLVFFAGAMNEALEKRVRLESDLARAIERGELRLHYQPIVDARTRQTLGAEALVRWQHGSLGLVPPLQFIPLAEEIGLIDSIGRWVIRDACQAIRRWQDADLLPPRISVNVSPRQVRPELLDQVLRELHDARIPPALIALEITESSLLGEDPVIAETLESLHRAGIALSVDDFGTGYSSLGYLKRFPVTSLKLDRVFVQGATFESDKRAITEAVLAMARELGLHVVAEGVETEEQLRFLAERGCQAVQGYLFAKPLREAVFTSWLARN
jgi:EAL domain-containing protein (putative c-di-GMP-specific phosphodiesterase class I)/GGDEF domain-containing protein/HAMP domain-containing protein